MAPIDEACQRLQVDNETARIAGQYFKAAANLTKRGSGRDVASSKDALAAICVYIAAKKTRLTDVTQQQVCSFSCITPMELKRQLAVIEPALSIVKISTSNNSVTYDTLIQHYKGNPEDNVPMAEVMSILNKKNIDAMTTAAQCAIFYWVRSHVLGLQDPNEQALCKTFRISQKDWIATMKSIIKNCTCMKDRLIKIEQDREAAVAAALPRTRSSAKKPKVLDDSMNVAKVLNILSKQESPKTRKVTFEDAEDEFVPPTPSKRAKTSTTAESFIVQTPTSKNKKSGPLSKHTSSPLSMFHPLETDESGDELADEAIVVESRKPFTAWESEHPDNAKDKSTITPTTVRREIPAPKEKPVTILTPKSNPTTFSFTPQTSTRTSETSSSPATPYLPTPIPTSKMKSPSKMTISISKIDQQEEQTRRQRRYLRAPFLDLSTFSWQPDPNTLDLMRRVERLERLAIQKFGDPWDDF